MIHLDSSFLIDLLRERRRQPGRAHAWLDEHGGQPLGISVFVACELEAGALAAARPQDEQVRVQDALRTIAMIFPDERFAPTYAALVATMQRAGRSIGTIDVLIATTAVVEGVPLLTGNRRHFEAVPGLRLLSYR